MIKKKSPGFWRIDEEAVKALHYADQDLGFSNTGITVFEIADFGGNEQMLALEQLKLDVFYSPIVDERNGNLGCYNGHILIFDLAKRLGRAGKPFGLEVLAPLTALCIRHEIMHAVDIFRPTATLGMKEAIAVALENNFQPEIIRKQFRRYREKGSVTLDRLTRVFEREIATAESVLDFYLLSGAFLSFLMEKVKNAKRVRNFYGLISGNLDIKERNLLGTNLYEVERAERTRTIYYRDLYKSLALCLRGTRLKADKLIEEFITFINS